MKENKVVKYENRALQKITNTISVTNKLLLLNRKPLNIIYLDDHKIFFDGVSRCICKKYPNATFTYFQNGNEALEYLINYNKKNRLIDLIITDIYHPGIDGIQFTESIRELEKCNERKIPILFITMYDDYSMVKKMNSIPLSKNLSKSASCEEINFAVYNLI